MCRLALLTPKPTKKAPTSIRCRNQEWFSAAVRFTTRTAVFTATANGSAPIMRRLIWSANGANAEVLRAITFSTGQSCSERCEPDLISATLASERPMKKTTQLRQHLHLLVQLRRQLKERRSPVRRLR